MRHKLILTFDSDRPQAELERKYLKVAKLLELEGYEHKFVNITENTNDFTTKSLAAVWAYVEYIATPGKPLNLNIMEQEIGITRKTLHKRLNELRDPSIRIVKSARISLGAMGGPSLPRYFPHHAPRVKLVDRLKLYPIYEDSTWEPKVRLWEQAAL